ncbi:cell division protein FtsZ [bacterium]|nr:cell division protein FtsZ [bacterium]
MVDLDLNEDSLSSDAQISPYQTSVKVMGIGGSGNNTLNRLFKNTVKSIDLIAVNTDAQNLLGVQCDNKLLIGKNITAGLGSGGDPEIGERSAEESRQMIASTIEGTDILFVTGGMGGGTGTGAMPVIGKIAREQGTLTIAIVTMPFSEEGLIRWENAQIGLERLRKAVDTVIVLRNDKLLELYPDVPLKEAFQKGDELLVNALLGFSSMILQQGIINLDFADISNIMRDGPNALIGVGQSNSENRAEEAAKRAMTHPMMESDIEGAQSALIHVTGDEDMTLKEARSVIRFVAHKMDPSAKVIWGVTIDKSLKKSIRVMIIVTGLVDHRHLVRKEQFEDDYIEDIDETESPDPVNTRKESGVPVKNNGSSIFDIKESIMASSPAVSVQSKPKKAMTQTTMLFYKIFEEEATGDLKRFDRAIHQLRENPDHKRAMLDARQSCKLLLASAQMFGFDEIAQLLTSIEVILGSAQSQEITLNSKLLESITLAMEMVVDLMENRNDGRGETGYIVERLKELQQEQQNTASDSEDEWRI